MAQQSRIPHDFSVDLRPRCRPTPEHARGIRPAHVPSPASGPGRHTPLLPVSRRTHRSAGRMPSPLPHRVPSQPVHLCRRISVVSNRPGDTFGYTLAAHHRDCSPLSNISVISHQLTVHRLATHLQIHHGYHGRDAAPEPLPDIADVSAFARNAARCPLVLPSPRLPWTRDMTRRSPTTWRSARGRRHLCTRPGAA